jgi:hypothetical protein
MSGRKQPYDDRERLSKEANAALDAVLQLREKIEVVIPGTFGSALIGTSGRGFVWKKGHLFAYPYADLEMVAFGDGFLKWVQFRGPRVGHKLPTVGTIATMQDAIQVIRHVDEEARARLLFLVESGPKPLPGSESGTLTSDHSPNRGSEAPVAVVQIELGREAGGHSSGAPEASPLSTGAAVVFGAAEQLRASIPMQLGRVAHLTNERVIVTGPRGASWDLEAIDRVVYGYRTDHALEFHAYDDKGKRGKPRLLRFGIAGSPAAEAFVRQVARAVAAAASQSGRTASSNGLPLALAGPGPAEPIAATTTDSEVLCTECWTVAQGRATDTALSCANCQVVYRFVMCRHCLSIDQIRAETLHSWNCSFCGGANDIVPGDESPRPTLDQRYRELLDRGLLTGEPDVRFVGAFTVVGGSGYELAPAAVCSVTTHPKAVRIAVELGGLGLAKEIPYGDITTLTVDGGALTTGPRFVGGGFGVKGAAEGIFFASILNAAFQRTRMTTLLRLTSGEGEVWLHHGSLTSEVLRLKLSPLWVRYEAAQRGGHSDRDKPPNDPVQLLARLGELRDAGVLTDEEFLAKKTDLLGRM